jgi:hypothetical protein
MKDREQNQFEGVQMPPTWCSGICRNAMNEVCIEGCAIKRDCSAFEVKPNLKLADMPRFPLEKSSSMTKEEKFTSVTVYLSKVVDHLQGTEDEQPSYPIYQAQETVDTNSIKPPMVIADLLQNFSIETEPKRKEGE